MYRLRDGLCPITTLWGAARHAARRLKVRVDVSGDWNISIIADDVRFPPAKAVKGLHTAVRRHHTGKFTNVPQQGEVAATLATEINSANFIAKLVSVRTPLNHDDWTLLFQARLESLPLRGRPGPTSTTKKCRRCKDKVETGRHVLNSCTINCQLYTTRHNLVQNELVKVLRLAGLSPTVNKRLPETNIEGHSRRPDIELTLANS